MAINMKQKSKKLPKYLQNIKVDTVIAESWQLCEQKDIMN